MESIKIFGFADEADSMIDGQISAMLRNGLDGLEIRGVDGVNIADISLRQAKEVKEKLDKAGLVTWSIGSPIGKIDIDDDFEPHIEKFKHLLEVAEILGAKNMRIFSFFVPENCDYEKYRQKVLDRLSKLCEIAKDYDITLCHENEKGIWGDSSDRCKDIFDAIPQIKCVFDPANFVQCNEDTLKAWNKLKTYVKYMHIKDACDNGDIVPAGDGIGNVEAITMDYLSGGGTIFTMEPHLMEFAGLAGLEKEGNTSEVGKRISFKSNQEAFDFACARFKNILKK